MTILHDIEQTFARIEADIKCLFELRRQHIESEAGHALARVDTRIARLKEWLGGLKKDL